MIPEQASTIAARVDWIFYVLCGVSAAIMLLVGSILLGFSIRYRRGSSAPRPPISERTSGRFEHSWTFGAAALAVFLFLFAASAQAPQYAIPRNAMEIHVVAKQWMWKTQQPSGVREIDELHVPVDTPIKLIMTSQDVIHSFAVPAFRIKQDVLPDRLTATWFEANKVGTFHLFCTEYCGTDHSRMIGKIVVLPKQDYAAWLARQPQDEDLTAQGGRLFRDLGCSSCHGAGSKVGAPALERLWGARRRLSDGREVEVDEDYVRTAILAPQEHAPPGRVTEMPSFSGKVSEEDLSALAAYLKALAQGRSSAR
jgi:cytochrome c oxidase subunit 2